MMRIALCAQGSLNWMGGLEYIKNIVRALAHLPEDVRSQYKIYLVCDKHQRSDFKDIEEYVEEFIVVQEEPPFRPEKSLFKKLQQNFHKFSRKASKYKYPQFKGRFDGKFEEFFNLEEVWERRNIDFVYPFFSFRPNPNYRSAAWIADFQHKYLPEYFSSGEINNRDSAFSLMSQQARTIVFSSQAAKNDFQKFFPESTVKAEVLSFKTFPKPEWYIPDPCEIQKQYNLPDKFFLISNQFWQHKNHAIVFEALKHLKNQSINPVVVCTGPIYDYRNPKFFYKILDMIHGFGIASQVYVLGLIPRLNQIQLMRRSLAVIQPSLFEGWSTVVEDARCFAKPVIMSNLPSNLEQNLPNHQAFDPYCAEGLAAILAECWNKLELGPNIEQETQARQNNLLEVQKFGYRFLEIAQNADN